MEKCNNVEKKDVEKNEKKNKIKKIALATGAVALTVVGGIGVQHLRWKRYWDLVRPEEVVK